MEETEDETRGGWYYRQLLGSANITGRKLFHTLTGNLSFQIEHHLFPDIPARRYPEIAPEIQALCEKYGLDYNTGPLHQQLGSVAAKIIRFAAAAAQSRQQLASGHRRCGSLHPVERGSRRTAPPTGPRALSLTRDVAGPPTRWPSRGVSL